MPSQLSPERLKSICFPRLVDLSTFWPTRCSRSASVLVPRKMYFRGCRLRSTISSPTPVSHCLRYHSTSASSGIVLITRGEQCVTLASCARFTHGESDHCGERLRGIDRGYLRRARQLEPPRPGRPSAGRTAFDYDPGGKLSRVSRRN